MLLGAFQAAIKLGGRSFEWIEDEMDAWIDEKLNTHLSVSSNEGLIDRTIFAPRRR